jgi:hypothetical protein
VFTAINILGGHAYCLLLRGIMHWDHFMIYCESQIHSIHSWFTHHSSLENTSRHLVFKAGETWQEMAVNFAYKYIFSHVEGIFNMP